MGNMMKTLYPQTRGMLGNAHAKMHPVLSTMPRDLAARLGCKVPLVCGTIASAHASLQLISHFER